MEVSRSANGWVGRTLLIANPAAQSGNGAHAAEVAASKLRQVLGDDLSVILTSHPKHASEIASSSQDATTVIALGGDGVVHEVVNGIMSRPAGDRPVLGIIPVGSGSDYAKTLGISSNIGEAISQLFQSTPQLADIGKVNDQYFMETLSFGLDAAIAIDTMERRKRSGRKGVLLYAESGIDQLVNHLDSYEYKATFDDAFVQEASSITFAVQIGPFYGGGFKIFPEAKLDDGLLDICISHPPIGIVKALLIFARAKSGRHLKYKNIELAQASTLSVKFDQAPPAQIDGEIIEGASFDISVCPKSIAVLCPEGSEAFLR